MHYITLWNPDDYYRLRSQNLEANLKEYDTNIYQITGL